MGMVCCVFLFLFWVLIDIIYEMVLLLEEGNYKKKKKKNIIKI